MRRLLLGSYLCFVFVLFYMACVWPEQALAVQYSRVVTLAARQAYVQANSTALSTYVAQRALSTTAGSLAIKLVPGVGWASLGITAATALYGYFYSQADLDAVKSGATPQNQYTINSGVTINLPGNGGTPNASYPEAVVQLTAHGHCDSMDSSFTHDWSVGPFKDTSTFFYQGPAFSGGSLIISGIGAVGNAGYFFCHRTGQPGSVVSAPSSAPTQQQIVNYINTQNNYHTNHEAAVPAPTGDNNTTIPVGSSELPSIVKDASTVQPTDKVIATNVPAPAGTSSTDTASQPTTTTTTMTTNPDGSQTEQETATSSVSCITGEHDGRTMQTVFDEHRAVWATSGLLALLATFQSLTWPSSLPSFTLHSNFFGDLVLNFNDYAGIFTALRTLIIATSTFLAVRYVFAGGGSNG